MSFDRTDLVFVYGTLRRGCPNCETYLAGAEFIAAARTREPYALYVGRYPYVVKDERVGPIVGEIWRVTPRILARLDRLEEHPDWYRREVVAVIDDAGNEFAAWLYFYPQPEGEPIPSGDYLDFAEARTAGRIDPED